MADEQTNTVEKLTEEVKETLAEAQSVPGELDAVSQEIARILHLDPSMIWITQIFMVIFITLLVSYFAGRALVRLRSRLERTHTHWDDTLVEAARKPLRALIWIVGVCYALEIIYKETGAEIFAAADAISSIGVISTMAWWLVRFINTFEQNIIHTREKKGEFIDHTTLSAVSKLSKAAVLITAGLVILQTLGFSIGGVLAFGGIGGIAVGFAAQDLLANFFGAAMVYFDRPFNVGDWIRSPDKEIEGTVEHIGWRVTRIRTFDQRPLYVPNSIFTNVVVENPSRMLNRRIFETIGLRYDDIDKVQAVTDEIRDMLQNHPEIDQNRTLMVYFDKFNDSSVDFFVYSFTKTVVWQEYHAVKHAVLLKISQIIESHGAEIAFPTRTLHVPEGVAIPNLEAPVGRKKPAAKKKTAKA